MRLGLLVKSKVGNVLGIDASTNSVAYCLFDKDGPREWGEIKFNGDSVWTRLADGQRKVAFLRQRLSPDLIVFESAVYIQNKKTVILLAYSFGAIVSSLLKSNSRVEEISPLMWQKYIGNKPLTKDEKMRIIAEHPGKSKSWYSNKGRELRKTRTKEWVSKSFGINVSSDNVSDAIAIASVAYQRECGTLP